jgi:protoporphyrinogen oxidase
MTPHSFAIVGAGLTGLTAAYRLTQAGHRVTVLEASEAVGGLAAGFELAGHRVERAYHFLYRTDAHILSLAAELGIEESIRFHRSSVATYYADRLYPMTSPTDLLRFDPLSLVDRVRAGLTLLWLQHKKDWRPLTEVTALDWLRRYAGPRVTAVLWEPLLRGKFDSHYDGVTMAWLWGRIVQRVESRDSRFGGEALGYIDGGFEQIITRLCADIEAAGGKIRTGTPVRRITHDDVADGAVLQTDRGGLRVDRALATVPSGVVAELIKDHAAEDPGYFSALQSVDYLHAVVRVFASRQRISPFYWHNVNSPGAPFVVFLSLTELVGADRYDGLYDGLHIYYIGAYVPTGHRYLVQEQTAVTDAWNTGLGTIFPDFDPSQIVDDHLFRLRNAQHIVDVGFESTKLVPHQTPCPSLLMCNFAQIYPMDRGTNYAVRDGNRMAEQLLTAVGDAAGARHLRNTAPTSFTGAAPSRRTEQLRPGTTARRWTG